ncbi:MAG: hypothetical protein ACRDQF_15735 [Thermocrispum sp.]
MIEQIAPRLRRAREKKGLSRADLEPHSGDDPYLLLVLDTSGGRRDDGPVSNGPRLVDKHSSEVTRLTDPDALARAERMALVRG